MYQYFLVATSLADQQYSFKRLHSRGGVFASFWFQQNRRQSHVSVPNIFKVGAESHFGSNKTWGVSLNKDLRCAFLHNTLHVDCSLQTCRRSASGLVNDVWIAKCFLVLHHKCYPIMFLEIVCSMINNLQSQKCSCVKQMTRSVLNFRLH